MRTFIQLKDGVGWASVNTDGEVEGSIEVEVGTGDFYIKKKYLDGVWSDADIIRFAEINEDGEIIEIKHTYYSSEANNMIMDSNTKGSSRWINGAWVHAEVVTPAPETVAAPETVEIEPMPPVLNSN
jgi:hypothetical protein